MNSSYNKILSAVGVSLLSAALLASCSEWTEPEPVSFEYATLEQKNPELYQAYMESLRAYRFSEHKVLIAKFDNRKEAPAGRADHINCLPDSTDYIILTSPSKTSEQLEKDIEDVKTNKGIRVLGQIDYNDLVNQYKDYKEKWEDEHAAEGSEENAGPADTGKMLEMAEFISQKMPAVIKPFEEMEYFEGINVIYNCQDPRACNEEELALLKAEQVAFFTPVMELLSIQDSRILFLEGTPQNLVLEENLAERARYILVPAQTIHSRKEFTICVRNMMDKRNVPVDRFVMVVTTTSLTDPTETEGTFIEKNMDGSDMTAIQGAAYWTQENYDDFMVAGVAVDHAQNNYYNLNRTYSDIREAISIMNPSPLK